MFDYVMKQILETKGEVDHIAAQDAVENDLIHNDSFHSSLDEEDYDYVRCYRCDGEGEIRDDDDEWFECPRCHGTGEIED